MADPNQLHDTFQGNVTLLVGIGDGGNKMTNEAYQKAIDEGLEDQVLPFFLNSRADFPGSYRDGVKTFRFDKPDKKHIPADKRARDYLHDDDDVEKTTAARRRRRFARYYVDSPENLAQLDQTFRTEIDSFVDEFLSDPSIDGPDAVNVVLMTAGGGGTGSGATPLVAAMLDTITSEIGSAVNDLTFHMWGVVSVSTVADPHSSGRTPDVNMRHLTNSAALVEELRAMAGEHPEASFPHEIPLVATSEGADLQREAYTVDSNPFEAVHLLQYAEDAAEETDAYREGVNRTAAEIAYYWMRQDRDGDGVENAADSLGHTFYEGRAISFEAPTDTVEDLFTVERALSTGRDRLSELREAQRDQRAALGQTTAALRMQPSGDGHATDVEFEDSAAETLADIEVEADGGLPGPVRKARERALQTTTNARLEQVTDEVLVDRIQTLKAQLAEEFHDKVDVGTVVATVFCGVMLETLTSRQDGHEFPAEVEQFVEGNVDALLEFDPAFDETAAPRIQWSEVIRPFLQHRLDEIDENLAQTTPLVDRGERKSLKRTRNQLETQIGRLDRLAAQYDRLAEAREATRERLSNARESLASDVDVLQGEMERLRGKIESTQTEISVAQDDREALRSELVNPGLERVVTLPVVEPERLDPDRFDERPSIAALIEQGVIDSREAANYLNKALKREDKPVLEDKLMNLSRSRSPATGKPIAIGSPETLDGLWQNGHGEDEVMNIVRAEFVGEPATVTQRRGDVATILVLYGNVHFENFLHSKAISGARVGDAKLFGQTVDFGDAVAYAELFDDSYTPVNG